MGSPNELSFLPDDYMERKLQRRTNVVCALLFCVVMVAIASAFTFTERAVSKAAKEHETVEKEYTAAAKRIQLVLDLQEKQKRMDQQAILAESLLEKVPRSRLLAAITNALPNGVSLLDVLMESKLRAAPAAPAKTAFEQKKAANATAAAGAGAGAKKKDTTPPPPAIKRYDVLLKITGLTGTDVQVAQFISKLNDSELLKDVNLVISEDFVQNAEHFRKFQIDCQLDPAAQITPETDRKTAAVEIKEN